MDIEEAKEYFAYMGNTNGNYLTEYEEKAIKMILKELEHKDKIINKVERIINNTLYFDDGADYCSALWEALITIKPEVKDVSIEFMEE